MANKIHLVMSHDAEGREPSYSIKAAFSSRGNAEAYMDIINEDLALDENHAFLDSVVMCPLTALFLQGKLCFEVEMVQVSMTNFAATVATTCPPLNTHQTYTRRITSADEEGFDEGTVVFNWTGWARSRPDAIKLAQVAAMSSWIRP